MNKVLQVGVTLLILVLAIAAGRWVWSYYLYSPWTRDGRIQADIVTLAPDVSGWVTTLAVKDKQHVKKGDVVFQIDTKRYQAVVDELSASVETQSLALELAEHELTRRQGLRERNTISDEELEASRIKASMAKAALALAQAKLDSARIDVKRATVRSPVDGVVVNMLLREGNFVSQGKPVLSVVADNSMYVTGYFEETKLALIKQGQKATITLMSGGEPLTGEVASIGNAIADTNTATNSQLLPQVQQTFNWVRLAQRVPVDITLTEIPDNTRLVAGMTASIRLQPNQE